jgi:hypothetical protein
MGPKIKNARTENTSAGSNRKKGIIGKAGWILAGIMTVERAAKLPKTAAPVRLTLLLANKPSANQTTKDAPIV